jgi:aarF domain-containing kinase
MEYLEGGQITDHEYMKKNKIDPFEVSNKLGALYAKMIFLNGYVHSDPHPGNILVHKNKKGGTDIVLLDHGLYAVSGNSMIFSSLRLNSLFSILRPSRIASNMNTRICGCRFFEWTELRCEHMHIT